MAELRVTVEAAASGAETGAMLFVPLCEGTAVEGPLAAIDNAAGGVIAGVLERGDFAGRKDETSIVYPAAGLAAPERFVLVGLGKRAEVGPDQLRRGVGLAVRQAERLRVDSLSASVGQIHGLLSDDHAVARIVAETAVLAAWDYRDLKTGDEDPPPAELTQLTLFAEEPAIDAVRRGAEHGAVTGRAANLARGLAIRPANVATPTFLAQTATDLAGRLGMECTVLDRADMKREGMGALLSVAAGTEQEPRFIALEYHGGSEGELPLVLVGKGVTFDSGGISLKPADRMEEMKYDMSGAAAVIGAMQGIAELGLKANVVALVPATENLPSGQATKPGDVIESHSGKTIEVINTDAEGRLILADALSWAQRYNPAAMLDAATLTGAVVVALGKHAIGLLGNDDALRDEVKASGERVGERCWPLPLWPQYRKQIDSTVADVKNTGGRAAGSITAGWFLREFAGDTPWAHLDIAGTAYQDDPEPWLRKGPTGYPARLFIAWVEARASA